MGWNVGLSERGSGHGGQSVERHRDRRPGETLEGVHIADTGPRSVCMHARTHPPPEQIPACEPALTSPPFAELKRAGAEARTPMPCYRAGCGPALRRLAHAGPAQGLGSGPRAPSFPAPIETCFTDQIRRVREPALGPAGPNPMRSLEDGTAGGSPGEAAGAWALSLVSEAPGETPAQASGRVRDKVKERQPLAS